MSNLQIIANNNPQLDFSLCPPFKYPLLRCNIDHNFKGPGFWFLEGLS